MLERILGQELIIHIKDVVCKSDSGSGNGSFQFCVCVCNCVHTSIVAKQTLQALRVDVKFCTQTRDAS